MAYSDEEPFQGMEMRDRAFTELSSPTGHLGDQRLDLDARRLALLGKRQRLKVNFKCVRRSLAALIIVFWDSEPSGGSPWLPFPQPSLRLGNQ